MKNDFKKMMKVIKGPSRNVEMLAKECGVSTRKMYNVMNGEFKRPLDDKFVEKIVEKAAPESKIASTEFKETMRIMLLTEAAEAIDRDSILTNSILREGNMNVKIKKITDTAILPTRADSGSAGLDLYVDTDCNREIAPGNIEKFGTGIAIEIPEGYVGLVFPRSGLASKYGITLSNCVGVIDASYRGEIGAFLHNHSKEKYIVKPHERVAQMIIRPYPDINLVEVDTLSDTERGEGGFGSTGR